MLLKKAFSIPLLLASVSVLAACSLSTGKMKIRPVDMGSLTSSPYDRFYEGAVSAINDRNYAQALEYLQEARSRTPRNVKVLNALGVVYDKLGRFDLSARYYAQAREIEPESRIVAENQGYSRVLQGFTKPEVQSVATVLPAARVAMSQTQIAPAAPVQLPPIAAPTQSVTRVALNEVPNVAALEAHVPVQVKAFPVSARTSSLRAVAKLLPPPLSEPAPVKYAVSVPVKVMPSAKAQLPPSSIAGSSASKSAIVKQASIVPVHAPIKPAPVGLVKQIAQAAPVRQTPRLAMAASTAKPRVLTIGQPLQIINASGKADRGTVVSQRLKALGWTVKPSDLKQVRPETALLYSPANLAAAQALQRTLPFPVRLARGAGSAMQLVIGRDHLSWRPRNAHIAALWQKGTVVASLQKASTRGIR